MKISLSSMPDQHATKLVDFPRLDGGLNLWELDYRLDRNQSPEMKNLWWQDGVLQCRDGQAYIYGPSSEQMSDPLPDGVSPWTDLGVGYACATDLFWDHAFFHIGDKLYYLDPAADAPAMQELVSGVPENRGTFFRYNDWLMYKNRGSFIKIKYDAEAETPFSAHDLTDDAYTPIILMNAAPSTGSGDSYQPENRLSPKKTIQYNASEETQLVTKTGNGSTKVFNLGLTSANDQLSGLEAVYFGATLISETLYSVNLETGDVTFTVAPASDVTVTFVAKKGVYVYQLPIDLQDKEDWEEQRIGDGVTKVFTLSTEKKLRSVDKITVSGVEQAESAYSVSKENKTVTFTSAPISGAEVKFFATVVTLEGSVTEVKVDGTVQAEGTNYAVNAEKSQIVFVKAPPVMDPPMNNTVEVTLSKENADALNAILDCPYATVFGGSQNVCIVLGGCEAQPNAFFWSGNDSVGMNAGYWPMNFYNLAGDSEDGITGFGKQYGTLIILKERSIGKSSYGVENVDDRDSISLTYTNVNSKIGCDLPWTIQLIENNIVFCNTKGGVHIVRDSTSALENNIECLSRNVNGTPQRPGLLEDVRDAGPELTCSFDDDNRYWICANGHVYLWDYLLSDWKDPSWFYFSNVRGIAYFRTVDKSYHLDRHGRVTVFTRSFLDYNGAIEKLYQFPPQFFDTYDRLKDILYCIFTIRSDTDSEVRILYQSDYEDRYDLTVIRSFSWRLSPRNLAYRCLSSQKFAHVARRKPGCRHIRHFSMRLSNNEPAQDLAILSAQIYFRYLGRDR